MKSARLTRENFEVGREIRRFGCENLRGTPPVTRRLFPVTYLASALFAAARTRSDGSPSAIRCKSGLASFPTRRV